MPISGHYKPSVCADYVYLAQAAWDTKNTIATIKQECGDLLNEIIEKLGDPQIRNFESCNDVGTLSEIRSLLKKISGDVKACTKKSQNV